jgi:sterol 24-C-methyltransferase
MLATQALPTNLMRGRDNVDGDSKAKRFADRFDANDASVTARKTEHMAMVNEYYDLVTDFYEYGWGQGFHFAPRYEGETFQESLLRHEYYLPLRGGFQPGQKVLDIGCGVGGPMRNIARFCGAQIIGINNNDYQIKRGREYNRKAGLQSLCSFVQTNFMKMPFEDESVDGAYAIEATCHAPDKTGCFKEIFRCLKPGSAFVGYEWIITDKYDAKNEQHRRIKHGIEKGDSLPDLETAQQVVQALQDAGFEVEEYFDVAEQFELSPIMTVPWHAPLGGSYTLSGFKSTVVGRWITAHMVRALERVRLAPPGSFHTSQILEEAAVNLVAGGKLGIFSPSFYFRARKPSA